MNNQEIYRKLKELKEQERIIELQQQKIKEEKISLQNECPHILVIKISDKRPHKIGLINTYICPICEKKSNTYYLHDIDKTPFNKSKIINLTSLNYEEYINFPTLVKEEILSNYDYYYNSNIQPEELSKNIIESINKNKNKKTKKLIKKHESTLK